MIATRLPWFKAVRRLALLCAAGLLSVSAMAETLYVYGPGGPAPAMKEAATAFGKTYGIKVEVTAGPTPQWIAQARKNADAIYSGSEAMMTDFTAAMEGRILADSIVPLYLRPLAILARPGNPKRIKGVNDLLRPDVQILVVQGAGQTGAWEDMAGRKGDLDTVKKLRRNIIGFASNSAEARTAWIEQPDIDVWLIWNIWQVANPELADVITIEPDYAIYRDTGIGVTQLGKAKPATQQFVKFLQSKEGAGIFKKWGWQG